MQQKFKCNNVAKIWRIYEFPKNWIFYTGTLPKGIPMESPVIGHDDFFFEALAFNLLNGFLFPVIRLRDKIV